MAYLFLQRRQHIILGLSEDTVCECGMMVFQHASIVVHDCERRLGVDLEGIRVAF